MPLSEERLQEDVVRIGAIPFLPILLDVVCAATGMGFAAVARVTDSRWIAGAVNDNIKFGLAVGGELPVDTTICHEIRENRSPVIIDHVAFDSIYAGHHTPAQYGFESYISFPIVRSNGDFFGTLCAIDPNAAQLNRPPMIALFTTLASLIAAYLDGAEMLEEHNLRKLNMYAGMELGSMRRDLATIAADADEDQKMRQLSLKVDQLLMALDPDGTFLK